MEKSTELRELIIRIYETLSSGDASFFGRHLSQEDGVIALGTDPNEWWEGYATILKVHEMIVEELSGTSLVADDPRAYCEGTVGWVSDQPKMVLPDGTEFGTRLTAVFHKEDSDWKIVQWHLSIGVPNEEAFGQELET